MSLSRLPLLPLLLLAAIPGFAPARAAASTPVEKIVCTHEPQEKWMGEARIRAIFGDRNFALVKFKISSGNCYEFYAINHDGSIVEAYYHPITGETKKYNKVQAKAQAQGTSYESLREAR